MDLEILLNFTLNWTHVQIKIENPNPYFLCSRIFSIDKFSIFYLQWNWNGWNWTDKFRFTIRWNFGKMKQNRTLKFSIDTSISEENKVTSFMCNTEILEFEFKIISIAKCSVKNEEIRKMSAKKWKENLQLNFTGRFFTRLVVWTC